MADDASRKYNVREECEGVPSKTSMTRRTFVGAGLLAGAAVVAGLAGCSGGGSSSSAGDSDSKDTLVNNTPSSIDQTYDVDVVIIGAGGSGVACALEAADQGLNVLVVEKQNTVGGATRGGIDWIFSLGDPYHEEIGLNVYTPAQLVAHELANSQYRADGTRWLDLINHSADNVEWIVENGGTINHFAEIDPEVLATTVINVKSDIQLVPLNIRGGANAGCVTPLSETAKSKGAEFLLNTEVTSLIQDDKGQVTGLYAEGDEGSIQVNAKAVVLATGGFSANEDLLEKAGWDKEQLVMCNMGVENGDGYRFALAAGAQDRIGEAAPMAQWVIEAFGGRVWNDPITGDNGLTQMAKQVLVNQAGKRFIAEDVPLSNPIMQVLPTKNNQSTYSIFTEGIFMEHFALVPDAASQLADALSKNNGDSLYKFDTLEECAKQFDLDADQLAATIEAYNGYCDAGSDEEFLKSPEYLQKIEPPYYIGRVKNGMQVYIGGINTSADYEVLDAAYEPVPGLYATGVDGCTLYKNMYTVTIGSGTFAHSIYSGRKAAQAIAKSING